MSLVAVLRIRGIEAEIYDPKRDLTNGELALNGNLYDDVAARIAARNADIVGFTALGCNFPFVVRTAQRLKVLRPGRPVLLGGPHASILHREILECFDCFDVVVRHEAEETLPRVLNALAGRLVELRVSRFSAAAVPAFSKTWIRFRCQRMTPIQLRSSDSTRSA